MHDYFDILGVSHDARAADIRRACCRHARRAHPDIQDGENSDGAVAPSPGSLAGARAPETESPDAAIDFVDVSTLVDRMRAAFFSNPLRHKA